MSSSFGITTLSAKAGTTTTTATQSSGTTMHLKKKAVKTSTPTSTTTPTTTTTTPTTDTTTTTTTPTTTTTTPTTTDKTAEELQAQIDAANKEKAKLQAELDAKAKAEADAKAKAEADAKAKAEAEAKAKAEADAKAAAAANIDSATVIKSYDTLFSNYDSVVNASSGDDSPYLVSGDLQSVVNNASAYSSDVVAAAQYLIDHPSIFTKVDAAISDQIPDGMISHLDLETVKKQLAGGG